MPGLNQLKKFSEDIKTVGDEEKIRAQRGEKPASIPLPEGINEADDSDDFIIGMPELPDADADAEEEKSSGPVIDTSATVDVPDVDAIIAGVLNESTDNGADAAPSEIPPEPEKPEETPIEDLDLDSLLKPTGNDGMDMIDEADLADFETDIPISDDSAQKAPEAEPVPADAAALDAEPLESLSDDIASAAPDAQDAALTELLSGFDADLDPVSAPADEGLESAEVVPGDIPSADTISADTGDSVADFGDIADLENFSDAPEVSEEIPSEPVPETPLESAPEAPAAEDVAPADDAISNLEMFDTSALDDFSAGNDSPAPEAGGESFDFDTSMLDSVEPIASSDDMAPSDAAEPSIDASQAGEPSGSAEPEISLDMPSFDGDFNSSDALSEPSAEVNMTPGEESADSGFGDFDTSALDDFNFGGDGTVPDATQDVPGDESSSPESGLGSFDMSEMEGVDFSKPASSGDEFPVTGEGASSDDDFILDNNFEIPGFSDTETADMGKKRPALDTVDFSGGKAQRPKNTLTDEEYVQFKKILANYPLNLRLAIEDVISNNDFTDEAVFELIEKILKKTSARQVATHVEKMLDVTIDVPRDYERRSFAQYEAYKQSFQYQLKNRIIPAAIVGAVLALVCFGLFKASVAFIYNPVMASLNYKQGYTLLENNEFPQSEIKFNEAVAYQPVKKWFFKYARGYRQKKQYERAGQMYRNILGFFNHDKTAGLEYAEMELYDRANYERAEEIVRRQVLDHHINDPDGILLLGDVFLEWADIDESKYEDAKREYLDLMQRYGENFLYLSRLLRYYIRTDKLREVLTLKNTFYPDPKSLGADDWTELSGYLLDKLYGPLSRNDEYLRSSIEDVQSMLERAIKANPENPLARYNLARYFVYNGYSEQAKRELEISLDLFDKLSVRTKKNVYREINATRILGELYSDGREYLKAQTVYTRGINLFNSENEATGLEGDENTGKLFADMGDIDYFISGELDSALFNYEKAIATKNDTPSLNFRVGAIRYEKNDYDSALASFIKVSESVPKDPNLLLALANVLSVRGDNFAAKSYYSDLLKVLDNVKAKQKVLFPQEDVDDYFVIDMYLKANNNLGVTLYRLARQTGNSAMNAEAMVRLSESNRAWDSLTRNQKTLVRMEGSNLAAQNSKYITHPYAEFEPAIYTDIPNILSDEKALE